MLKNFLTRLYSNATELNHLGIESLLESQPDAVFLDLWCDDGVKTLRFGKLIQSDQLHGVEIVDQRLAMALSNWVVATRQDLNSPLTYASDSFNVVLANQVIEHLSDVDNFAREIYRILKPGWYAIISTENGSSWCNIFAAVMWWQIFSLTNVSGRKSGIGNPLALHSWENIELTSWTHKTIFNYLGLKEFFEAHGFRVEKMVGSGYFPLPWSLWRLDVRHSHFLSIKIRKIS